MHAIDTHTFPEPPDARSRVCPLMPPSKVKRKLTTILCADVQGYSSLMGADEAQTLERLQRYRAIMAELFERHDGRKVNTWGDAIIAEFPSVVEAVRCGVEIQDAVGAENADLPKDKQMWFRIGINLGDVMQDGTDLYGDGVNVASRLEGLADPGGIMVSETVYNLTHKQLSFAYDFAGEQVVKGQEQPILGYRVRMPNRNQWVRTSGTLLEPTPPYQPQGQASRGPAATAVQDRSKAESGRLARIREWYFRQPRSVRLPISMIGLLFTINLLTSGLRELWFVYPSAPFAALVVFQYLAGAFRTRKS